MASRAGSYEGGLGLLHTEMSFPPWRELRQIILIQYYSVVRVPLRRAFFFSSFG